jgi:hypothetical protein
MAAIHVQIQPGRASSIDVEKAAAELQSLDATGRVTKGNDNGPYINIDSFPRMPRGFGRRFTTNCLIRLS